MGERRRSSRALSCRRCLSHGRHVPLKGHAVRCPFDTCTCNECVKLVQKRLRSYRKRNGDLLEAALKAKEANRLSMPGVAAGLPPAPTKETVAERITVISYDIWKNQQSKEKKEDTENDQDLFVSMPTIPPMRVHIQKNNVVSYLPPVSSNPLAASSSPSATTLSSTPTPIPSSSPSFPPPPPCSSSSSLPPSSLLHPSPSFPPSSAPVVFAPLILPPHAVHIFSSIPSLIRESLDKEKGFQQLIGDPFFQ